MIKIMLEELILREFLELMRDAGVKARGIDLSLEAITICREKGFDAEAADLFAYVAGLPDESLGGVFCAHVVEHLPPERVPDVVDEIVRMGGRLYAVEPRHQTLEDRFLQLLGEDH